MPSNNPDNKFVEECKAMNATQLERYIYGCLDNFETKTDSGIPQRSTTYDSLINVFEEKLTGESLRPFINLTGQILYTDRHTKRIFRVADRPNIELTTKFQSYELAKSKAARIVNLVTGKEKSRKKLLGDSLGAYAPGKISISKLLKHFNIFTEEQLTIAEFRVRVAKATSLIEILPEKQFNSPASAIQGTLSRINRIFCNSLKIGTLQFNYNELLVLVRHTAETGECDVSIRKDLNRIKGRKSQATHFLNKNKNAKSFDHQIQREDEALKISNEIRAEIDGRTNSLREKKAEVMDRLEALDVDTALIEPHKLPWFLLPPGAHSILMLIKHFNHLESSGKLSGRIVDISRLERIEKGLRPSHCYIGEDGFEGYVAYCFRRTKLVVLECPIYGNATYILKDNWQTISKLSKWEARREHSNKVIVIRHSETWFERIKENLELYY